MSHNGTSEIHLATPSYVSLEVKVWEASIAVLALPQQSPCDKPKIQKVPNYLRNIESNAKCFDPVLVSLGPLHHSNPGLKPMEQVKALFMQQFATDSQVSFQELYDKIFSVLDEAKDCYVSSALNDLTDTAFCRMMCLDGCFIIRFLMIFPKYDYNSMNIHQMALVHRDLLLLENQIPFIVLRSLMIVRGNTYNDNELVRILTLLMDLESGTMECQAHLNNQITHGCPTHLLSLSCTLFSVDMSFFQRKLTQNTKMISFWSATELRTAGIYFCKWQNRLIDQIEFDSYWCWGRLQLPPLSVHRHTKSKLLNQAAYEACPNGSGMLHVTSYIWFMDKLINQAEDVALLRSEGVLFNHLGCDQQVSDLFNEITDGLMPNLWEYNEIGKKIDAHYKNKFYIWLAHLRHTYISSPWKAVGLVAAIIVIILTSMQAWFAAFPQSTK